MNRGRRGESVFQDKQDYPPFIELLKEIVDPYRLRIAAYIAMGHLYFDSVAAFQTAFGPHAESMRRDIPNFTDIQPTIQISEVKP